MKKIIVPLDFSECSLDALKVASDIARSSGAEVVLMHWYLRPGVGLVNVWNDENGNTEYKEKIYLKMDEYIGLDYMQGIAVSKLVLKDKDVSDVLKSDQLRDAELIIMGTTGASNLKEIFMGSNAQKIVRHASCPVLAIKEYMDFQKLGQIIFASDFNREETVTAYKKLAPLFALTKAEIHLLKVITPSYFEDTDVSEAKIYQFKKNAGIQDCKSVVYNNYSPEEGITEYSYRFDNSLICIATKGLKGFSHFMSGSVSEDLVNRLNKPILTIKM